MPKAPTITIEPNAPLFGETIHLTVVPIVDKAIADVRAYQNGQLVYRELCMIYKGDYTATLGPTPSWLGGTARGEIRIGQGGNRLTFPKNSQYDFDIG